MNNIAVIGVGNLLQQDEGVGVHAIRILNNQYDFNPAIDLIDGGTTGLDLIPLVENREKVLFIDALELNKPPGTIAEFKNEEIQVQLNTKMSLHHLGLQDLIATLQIMDKNPPNIYLVGIQSYSIITSCELSEDMIKAINSLLQSVLKVLGNWGVTASCKI